MISLVNTSANILVDSWKRKIEAGRGMTDIKIDFDMRTFSGDVISRACFGSNYAKGQEIFNNLRLLQEAMSKKVFLTSVPGMR